MIFGGDDDDQTSLGDGEESETEEVKESEAEKEQQEEQSESEDQDSQETIIDSGEDAEEESDEQEESKTDNSENDDEDETTSESETEIDNEGLEKLERRISEMEDELSEIDNSEIEMLKDRIAEKTSLIEELKQKIDSQKSTEELEKDIKNLREQVSDQKDSDVEEIVNSEIDSLEDKLDSRIEEVEETASEPDNGDLEEFQESLNKLEEKVDEAGTEGLDEEFSELKDEFEDLKDLEKKVEDMEDPKLEKEINELFDDPELFEKSILPENRREGKLPRIYFEKHLYLPLLIEDRNEDKIIESTPPGLNVGEWKFIQDLKEFFGKPEADELIGDHQVYVLRNQSRGHGIGFLLEGERFFPDFIVWVKNDKEQHICFIDPHGLQHEINVHENNKVQFSKDIKEYENQLNEKSGRNNIFLHSFIISETDFDEIKRLNKVETKADCHELGLYFREKDDSHIDEIFREVLRKETEVSY